MYLDTYERDEVQKMVMSLYFRWLRFTLKRISKVHSRITLLLFILLLGAMATVTWVLPADRPWWVLWIPIAVFMVLAQLTYLRSRKQMQQVASNASGSWFQEIVDVELNGDERMAFLQLLATMRDGSHDDVSQLIEEAIHSSALAQLTFIRELRTGLREM
ncbi:MAG: hypothetical protein Q8R32_02685 [bacterium]|nr:hypothetical protein [bacterium]